MAASPEIPFGLMQQKKDAAVGTDFAEFLAWLAKATGLPIKAKPAATYEELDRIVASGEALLAWVPPIVFLRLDRIGAATPLVTHTRAAGVTYESVLIVNTASSIRALDSLRGTRAAWVDPWSAAGYVLPRLKLATLGMDPRETFKEERFAGSHDAAVKAVLDGSADVAGTYARRDADGRLVRGGWTEMAEADGQIHMLTTFGPIPSDSIVAHKTLPAPTKQAVTKALLSSPEGPIGPLVRKIFGVQKFRQGGLPSFGALRRAIDGAVARGLFPGAR